MSDDPADQRRSDSDDGDPPARSGAAELDVETRLNLPTVATTGAEPDVTATIRYGQSVSGAAHSADVRRASVAWGPSEAAVDYLVESEIARGAMGVVYAARQPACQRHVVLKCLKPGTDSQLARAAFLREARITASIDHPGVPTVHDICIDQDERPFYVSRWITGTPWSDSIRERDLDANLDILLRICDAVAYAHSQRIVHRDLKPENIMLGSFGEVLVMDWGLATDFRSGSSSSRMATAIDTENGPDQQIAGSPGYMAPEMADPKLGPIDQRSDVYLLGAILFEILTGKPPHSGASIGECLANAAANRIRDHDRPGEIMEVALRAMATDPDDRHRQVGDFVAAIRDCQRHREARTLLARAEELGAEPETVDPASLVHAATLAERAGDLWPESEQPQALLRRIRHRLIDHHLANDDAASARASLDLDDPADHAFHEAIAAAERRRQAHRRRRRVLVIGIPSLSLGLILVLALFANEQLQRFGTWEPVFDRDFTADAPGLLEHIHIASFEREAHKALTSLSPGRGLVPSTGDQLFLDQHRVPADVRVRLRVRWTSRVDGLEILINSVREDQIVVARMPIGYGCQFGGFNGDVCLISRQDAPALPSTTWSCTYDFEVGRVYELTFQRLDEILSLHVDGREILRRREALPLAHPAAESVAIRSWAEGLEVLSWEVDRRVLPRRASPLVAADELIAHGLIDEAARRYAELGEDYADQAIAARAWLRAGLATIAAGTTDARKERLRRCRDFLATHDPNGLRTLRAAEAEWAWRHGHFDHALDLAASCLDGDPEHRAALRLTTIPVDPDAGLSTAQAHRLLRLVGRGPAVAMLDLSGLGIADLAPLRGMPLAHLRVKGNHIEDLAPLAGMPLRYLDCSDNRIADLDALRGMPLRELRLDHNRIEHLEPLADSAIGRLHVEHNAIRDLEPLAGLPLRWLFAEHNRIDSAGPLAGLPLERLDLSGNRLRSIAGIDSPDLTQLALSFNPLTSLEGLDPRSLRDLSIDFTAIGDLAPVAEAPLRLLRIQNTLVTQLPAPNRWQGLRSINATGSALRELEGLRGIALEAAWLSETAVTAIDAIAQPELRYLELSRAPVRDLAALERAPLLGYLNVRECPLEGLAGLVRAEPFACWIGGGPGTRPLLQATIAAWQEAGWHHDPLGRRVIQTNRLLAAIADEDWPRARELLRAGDLPVVLPIRFTVDETEALMTHLDARPAALTAFDDELEALVLQVCGDGRIFWWGSATAVSGLYRSQYGPLSISLATCRERAIAAYPVLVPAASTPARP